MSVVSIQKVCLINFKNIKPTEPSIELYNTGENNLSESL